MTPIRVKVEEVPGGWQRVTVGCPCARLGRHVAAWEDVESAVEELRAQHRREAPTCRHVWLPMGRR